MNETKKNIDELEIKMEEANIGVTMVNGCKIRLIFRAENNADIKLEVLGILKEAYLASICNR